MTKSLGWWMILQLVILHIITYGGDSLNNGYESVESASVRSKVTSGKEAKKFKSGKLTSGIEHEKRKRTYGSRIFIAGSNNRRHLNNQGGHPVRNYDFYDQQHDFEWFKEQGNNPYPYHGRTPAYSHKGYDEYQNPPDPHAVSQAMNLLEKHMTSAEALSSDNMFRNNEGRKHGDGNYHMPMMNKIEGHGSVNGVNDERYDDKLDGKFAMKQNNWHEGQERHEGGHDQHDEYENHNGNKNQHEHETQFGSESQEPSEKSGQEDRENDRNKMQEDEHMTEHYQWENVKGPELPHVYDPFAVQNHQEHREGWPPLKQHEDNHGSPDASDENNHDSQKDHNQNDHGSHLGHDENNQKSEHAGAHESNYLENERKAVDEQSKEHHGGGLEPHDEGRASKESQKSGSEEEYIDFPQKSTNPNTMKDSSNRNSMVDTPVASDGPAQQHEVAQRQESTDSQHHSNHLYQGEAYENSDRQANIENKIRINVGYPHYRVPNTHIEVAKNEPHQGPERGGGLWGNQPGEGEQFYGEKSNQNIENPKVSTGSTSQAESNEDSSKSNKGNKNTEVTAARGGDFDENTGEKAHGNGLEEKQGHSKSSKITRIPVTITTGVYDSRDIFTINRKKEYIHSKPLINNVKRREAIQKSALLSTRKPPTKMKTNSSDKHWEKKKRMKSNGIKHFASFTKISSSSSKDPLPERFAISQKDKKTRIDQLSESDEDAELPKRHGTGGDFDAVHGHPAISDEESLHSSPDELLDIANNLRHRAEEYDSKAKELENQAEIQDHQHNYHGSISQHHSHEGPERGGNQHGEEHSDEGNHEHDRIGPWNGPAWHGPGPFGTSHISNENGHGSHGGEADGGHGNGNESGEEGHDDHVIHFKTGYPYYHVPKQHTLPLVEYEKPAPPVHGLNPYEVLTSEQFHRPMLPAGHGNLPYGHNQRTLQSNPNRALGSKRQFYMSSLDSRSVEPGAVVQLPKYDGIPKDTLSDDNVNNFLLK